MQHSVFCDPYCRKYIKPVGGKSGPAGAPASFSTGAVETEVNPIFLSLNGKEGEYAILRWSSAVCSDREPMSVPGACILTNAYAYAYIHAFMGCK